MSHKEIVSAEDGQFVYTCVLRNGCCWVGQKVAPFTAGPWGAQVSSVRSASHRAGGFVDSHLSRAVSSLGLMGLAEFSHSWCLGSKTI